MFKLFENQSNSLRSMNPKCYELQPLKTLRSGYSDFTSPKNYIFILEP